MRILIFISAFLISNIIFTETIEFHDFKNKISSSRYKYLTNTIRCPVCQGQSIAGSNAPLAKDLRNVVAKMINNNATNEEIITFMTTRYGNFVSFKPPINVYTYLLWFAPLIFIVFAALLLVRNKKSQYIKQINSDKITKAKKLLKK